MDDAVNEATAHVLGMGMKMKGKKAADDADDDDDDDASSSGGKSTPKKAKAAKKAAAQAQRTRAVQGIVMRQQSQAVLNIESERRESNADRDAPVRRLSMMDGAARRLSMMAQAAAPSTSPLDVSVDVADAAAPARQRYTDQL